MTDIPTHLILPDKVYVLTAEKATGGRAFDRELIDYLVEGVNPLSDSDTWRTRLGMSGCFSGFYVTLFAQTLSISFPEITARF
jgi:hypothetical protein